MPSLEWEARVSDTFNILWRDLGSPIEPGWYLFAGKRIHVARSNILAAACNPDAVFPAVNVSQTGETRYILGPPVRLERHR